MDRDDRAWLGMIERYDANFGDRTRVWCSGSSQHKSEAGNAGPSTSFAAKSAANSAQDDRAWIGMTERYDANFGDRTLQLVA